MCNCRAQPLMQFPTPERLPLRASQGVPALHNQETFLRYPQPGTREWEKSQIQMLARKLITPQIQDDKKVEAIISFLCSESGSHDYSIHRREARDILGLNIEKPTEPLYKLIKEIYDNIVKELDLTQAFDPNSLLGGQNQVKYSLRRALIESVDGGSYFFVSEGNLTRRQVQVQPGIQQIAIQDQRDFEGWRHEDA